jgi:hypothetical protein
MAKAEIRVWVFGVWCVDVIVFQMHFPVHVFKTIGDTFVVKELQVWGLGFFRV